MKQHHNMCKKDPHTPETPGVSDLRHAIDLSPLVDALTTPWWRNSVLHRFIQLSKIFTNKHANHIPNSTRNDLYIWYKQSILKRTAKKTRRFVSGTWFFSSLDRPRSFLTIYSLLRHSVYSTSIGCIFVTSHGQEYKTSRPRKICLITWSPT